MESELQPYYDETGYLSNLAINKFLVTKKVCRLGRNNELILLLDRNYKTPYFDMRQQIESIIRKNSYKKMGSMGVNIDVLEKDVNKVDRGEITQLKKDINEQEEINADEINF